MAIDLTPEQREVGQANYARAVDGMTRRRFLQAVGVTAGAALPAAAVYFGYQTVKGKPVKAALIGGGDEGGVLVGEHNPDFVEFIAVADVRPYNLEIKGSGPHGGRIFDGDPKVALRKGFKKIYGNQTKIKAFRDYKQMLDEVKDIEMVVIATPLVTHAPIAIECLKRGKHVLCEKLMARSIGECKQMIIAARDSKRLLSIGHQRHYSMLYDHAHDLVDSGILGDIKHIRALWHRNFTWPYPKDDSIKLANVPDAAPTLRDGWYQPILEADYAELKEKVSQYEGNYKDIYELVRWRLFDRTGGGLMAELGSHQMDACSIFLGHVQPLSVQGVGGKFFFGPGKNDRESDDSIFVTYEFPGRGYYDRDSKGEIVRVNGAPKVKDPHDLCVVTYSAVNTNGFEQYGECVMGSRGTLIVEAEQKAYLFAERDPGKKAAGDPKATAVGVVTPAGGKPAIESSGTWGPAASVAAGVATPAGSGAGPISRGYREEMEDFAYCVREWNPEVGWKTNDKGEFLQKVPRCHGKVAMADAIIALTANLAMKKKQRIEFKPEWFDPAQTDANPETQA